MKWIRLLWVALLTVVIISGCNPTVVKHSENSKTQHVSNNILDEMEGKNGHTLERHAGKSDNELEDRLHRDRHITAASTYYNKETATKAVQDTLRVHDREINHWLYKSHRNRLVLKTHHSFAAGKSVLRSDMRVHDHLHDTLTVLQKDPSSKLKYKIITSYPIVKGGS
ncbi:RNase A-like domain-containing lipoprotein [Scopulibacillus cellulosilyticus]|uniref:RNase A-like domain-containing lipoprotein n=1 Tax=Scopulibacillus cellulosilyticus TaxID=2665665 RepID=A0ABW2Q157_9BACL